MLRKRGDVYIIDVTIDGKRIRRSLGTTNRLKALDRYASYKERLEAEYQNTLDRIRFDDFSKQYMEWAWSEKPKSALRESQRLEKIRFYLADKHGITYLDEITPRHIDAMKAELQKPAGKKKRVRSKATVNRYLQLLRGMFYKAIDWELYNGRNPVRKVRFYKERSPVRALSTMQVKRVLDSAQKISQEPLSPLQAHFYDMVILALNSGLRKSEVLNLKWRDVKEGFIEVKGKGEKVRRVPLNSTAQEIIITQPRNTEYVFDIPNRSQPDLFRRTVAKIRKDTGVDFRFHALRHTFATRLIERGVDLVTIASILGHSKFTISLIYSHTDEAKMTEAVRKLE